MQLNKKKYFCTGQAKKDFAPCPGWNPGVENKKKIDTGTRYCRVQSMNGKPYGYVIPLRTSRK